MPWHSRAPLRVLLLAATAVAAPSLVLADE